MALNPNFYFHSLPQLSTHKNTIHYPVSISNIKFTPIHRIVLAISKDSDTNFKDDKNPKKTQKPKTKSAPETTKKSKLDEQEPFPTTIPKKPRRGRRSEAAAVEDFMRNSLEETFAAIKEQSSDVLLGKYHVFKDKIEHDDGYDHGPDDDDDDDDDDDKKGMVIEEDDPNWPLDAEVGWGIRASEYFEKHPIKNVVGEDGVEIDWEGELDDNLVKEINCLEWESFAFHPSPLIVLVFERYNRASENWRALKELEKAAKVYWNAKDRLPPRTVKLDMNIETDLAYALKIRECPQLLFLRGNRIIYREPQIRTADELVQMIAHFYYKARKPSWLKDAKLYS